jgi:hypothetical protein
MKNLHNYYGFPVDNAAICELVVNSFSYAMPYFIYPNS